MKLLRDMQIALLSVGFDPLRGFYHVMVPGRPALALDMMEAFRPLIVDSTVLRSINTGRLNSGNFVQSPGCCLLTQPARKEWIAAYEQRVDEMITHPAFGYQLSYRRVFHLESRLLSRFIEKELHEYLPLMTR